MSLSKTKTPIFFFIIVFIFLQYLLALARRI